MDEKEEKDMVPETKSYIVKTEERSNEIEVISRRKWQCEKCSKAFTQNAGLYNHMKRKHGLIVYAKASILCKEPNCDFKCSMRDKLQSHLVNVHKKPLAFSTLKFSSMADFEDWKEVFEKQEKCRFVKKSGTRIRNNTGEKHTYLYCSRSGTFISNSKGKRTQIKKGTCKISNYCTASIDCIEDQNGTVIAKLCSTHYGHEPSVEYLRLTKSDKSVIADKLAQGVPRDVVIDNVRASVGENIDRIHFLTMKDIRNIERSYGIKNDGKQKSSVQGFASVNEWVREMETLGDESPVTFYKAKYSPEVLNDNCKCLETQDFCLILMTKGQQEIFKKFGQNGVFYVTWLNISNGYDLSLLTLMVADDLNEAFPVGYMICSRMTTEIEVLFFKVIQDQLGSFCARAIMTDDRKSLYDSWCSVMGFVPYHLLSNRFVDADWRDRLISVQNEDVQCAVYEVLYSYLSCTDSTKFEENLSAFIKHLKENEDTLIFGLYFEDTYLHRVRLWAGCYDKKCVGINEHLNLDIVYNELLSVCNNKGKFSKLLDKTLQGLLTIVRDRQHNRISKIAKQAQELVHHHGVSMNINLDGIQAIENRKWQIKSESTNLIFTVTRKTYECNMKCPLVCTDCKMCAHMFECTCKVYNFDRTMCKHIHAIGRLFQKSLRVLEVMDLASSSRNEVEESTERDVKPSVTKLSEKRKKEEENKVKVEDEINEGVDTRANTVIKITIGRSKESNLVKKIKNMLESIQHMADNSTDTVLLKKCFIKLKKVKNFLESGYSKPEIKESGSDNEIKKRGRGRPKKIKDEPEDETSNSPKKKVLKSRKSEDEESPREKFFIRPRKLQEILQDDLLQEQISQQEDNDHDYSCALVNDNILNQHLDKDSNLSKETQEGKEDNLVRPKKRGRKPKPKTESYSNEGSSDFKKIKLETPEEKPELNVKTDDVRRSKRVIKVKNYDFDEPYLKRKESVNHSETKNKIKNEISEAKNLEKVTNKSCSKGTDKVLSQEANKLIELVNTVNSLNDELLDKSPKVYHKVMKFAEKVAESVDVTKSVSEVLTESNETVVNQSLRDNSATSDESAGKVKESLKVHEVLSEKDKNIVCESVQDEILEDEIIISDITIERIDEDPSKTDSGTSSNTTENCQSST